MTDVLLIWAVLLAVAALVIRAGAGRRRRRAREPARAVPPAPGLFTRLAAIGRLVVYRQTGLVSMPSHPFPRDPPRVNRPCEICGRYVVGLPRGAPAICETCRRVQGIEERPILPPLRRSSWRSK